MTAREETSRQIARCDELHRRMAKQRRALRRECSVQRAALRRERTRIDMAAHLSASAGG
jgi:hypothetical protein